MAFPILKKYEIPATLYATSGFIDGDYWLWPDKLHFLIRSSEKKKAEIGFADTTEEIALNSAIEKKRLWVRLNAHCLSLKTDERNAFIDKLISALDVEVPAVPVDDYRAMSWEQVKELSDHGINIGAHTVSHPILSKLDSEELKKEIAGSKSRIEDAIKRPVSCFCYPNGEPSDYTSEVKKIVRESGFTNATVAYYDKKGLDDLFEIRRHGVGENNFQFLKVINGLEQIAARFR